jgi:hypothetical protein
MSPWRTVFDTLSNLPTLESLSTTSDDLSLDKPRLLYRKFIAVDYHPSSAAANSTNPRAPPQSAAPPVCLQDPIFASPLSGGGSAYRAFGAFSSSKSTSPGSPAIDHPYPCGLRKQGITCLYGMIWSVGSLLQDSVFDR